jgi:hypothetical protein
MPSDDFERMTHTTMQGHQDKNRPSTGRANRVNEEERILTAIETDMRVRGDDKERNFGRRASSVCFAQSSSLCILMVDELVVSSAASSSVRVWLLRVSSARHLLGVEVIASASSGHRFVGAE